MKYAIRIRYLESRYTGDGKWHQHTTKWYADSEDAWNESDRFLAEHKNIDESSGSILHK
jgi:hypothetical protein